MFVNDGGELAGSRERRCLLTLAQCDTTDVALLHLSMGDQQVS